MERISYQDVPKGMFEGLRQIEALLENTTIDKQLLQLIRTRISQMNGCAYCVDMHHKELKHAGETELRLASLCVWEETPYFSEKERVALTFAETLNRLSGSPIPSAVYNGLTSFFTKAEICYLTLAVGQIHTWNVLMKTFQFTPGKYKVAD